MIDLNAASQVFGLFERLLKLIVGRKDLTKKNFDDVVTPLFTQLDGVVQLYHKILWELDRDVRTATTHTDIAAALERAKIARHTFTMSRARILGELSGALKFEEKGGSEDYDRSLIEGESGLLLWNLARSVNSLFRSPVDRAYTYMSYEFENVFRTEELVDLGARRHEITETLKGGILSLTDAWQFTCYDYGLLVAHYRKL